MNTSPRSYLIITNQGQTLPPFKLTKSKHILGRDSQIADRLVSDDWGIISRCQATLIQHQGTYIIYDGDRLSSSFHLVPL